MKHLTIAWKLREIADLLEFLNENPFKVRAYRKVARRLEHLTEDLEQIYKEGRLTEIVGIGKSIAQRIEEILIYGDSPYLKELKSRVPEELAELLEIPGVGPKMASKLHDMLGISTVTELEAALQAHKIRELPGMNNKTEANLIRSLRLLRTGSGKIFLRFAFFIGRDIIARLERVKGVKQLEIVGSARRYKESISNLNLLAAAEDGEELLRVFTNLTNCQKVIKRKENSALILTQDGVFVELFVVEPEDYPLRLVMTTGSKAHLKQLERLAERRGWRTEYNYWFDETGKRLIFESEEEVYESLGLKYIIPELREGEGEIEAAMEGRLPRSVRLDQIKGDLHIHTRWSDGVNTIEEMAKEGQALGYKYMAICDHFRSLKVANGLSISMLMEQMKAIDELNAQFTDFYLLKGIEVDILKDGQLDFPDELLAQLDLVVASIHSEFRGSKEELTNRLIAAMENPHVDIIAYPTGRLINQQNPYMIDMERVLRAAKETGTVMEVNASLDRLDFYDKYLKICKTLGVKVAINTDAHSIKQLGYMEYGVGMVRRGWLEDIDVINTYSRDQLLAFLKR
ncbi:hypothetical protein BBF96_09845 [Anoxybacter fermentans]|uniref:DNA-directed DNA polymerase n=1 Tax=Anoxybacter fermentans TaxID=1323375 RepID=A0A3Q9HSV0_9FIRM|nr:DNA polymerase/3'-5' exonuclease PolX [Anoxybacter fermentans]AZR74893.1 hypothetical protein BBF96_09845 [Anoxybacter fermentans]